MDWAVAAGNALGGIGSIASGLFNANQAAKNRAFQERMYEKQKQDTLEQWNRENAYNLPSAQLQRLKDAGLNPLLMYGEGGISGNLAANPQQMAQQPSGAQASANFQTNMGQAILQAKMLQHQIDNIDADSNLKTQQAFEAAARTIHEGWESNKSQIEYEFNYQTFYDRQQAILYDNQYKRAVTKLQDELAQSEPYHRKELEAYARNLNQQTDYLEQKLENETRMTDQEIKESEQRIENSIKITSQSIKTMKSEERKNYADAAYSSIMANLYGDPEYKKNFLEEQAQKVRKAIFDGDTALFESLMKEIAWQMSPKAGQGSFRLQKFLKNWIIPIADGMKKATSIVLPNLDTGSQIVNTVF